jgi:hypothetical protein
MIPHEPECQCDWCREYRRSLDSQNIFRLGALARRCVDAAEIIDVADQCEKTGTIADEARRQYEELSPVLDYAFQEFTLNEMVVH